MIEYFMYPMAAVGFGCLTFATICAISVIFAPTEREKDEE